MTRQKHHRPRANLDQPWKHDMYRGPLPPRTIVNDRHEDLRSRIQGGSSFNGGGQQTVAMRERVGGLVSDRMTDSGARLFANSAGLAAGRGVAGSTSANGSAEPLSIRGTASATVEVTNLHSDVSEEDLKATFGSFGRILDVKLARDGAGRATGVARIKFETRGPALNAIAKFNGQIADGKILSVTEVQPGLSIAGASRTVRYSAPSPLARLSRKLANAEISPYSDYLVHLHRITNGSPASGFQSLSSRIATGGMYSDRMEAAGSTPAARIVAPAAAPQPSIMTRVGKKAGAGKPVTFAVTGI
ncbi:hypothetical protein HK104_005115 [Borealophlyctis nickersoniae]|nr:hypothetical protein HK104_005115 [Borealophlyctis nickersoniae]